MSEQIQFDFTKQLSRKKLDQFSQILMDLQSQIGIKISARGWNYICEGHGYITKAQFDKVEGAINRCRKLGILPVDFVAEEDARAFVGVEKPDTGTVEDTLKWMLKDVLEGQKYYTPDWWDGEKYYVQMVVEKIDLKTLFEPVCHQYHIPIANAKGWQSILQRAEYARRFKEAQDMGLECILLYGGDLDADGVRIADTMRKNLEDIKDINWQDGEEGYDPAELKIQRFCLDYDFVIKHKLTWIDNLITGSGKDLAHPSHKNFKLPYVQQYIKKVGKRKCEANALVTIPELAATLCRETIENVLGDGARERFDAKRELVEIEYNKLLTETKLIKPINKILGIKNTRGK